MDFGAIEQAICLATGSQFRITGSHAVGGGCINEALCLEGVSERYFLKLNSADRLSMFEAEAAGLDEIAASRAIRIPRAIAAGCSAEQSWLVLEFIEFCATSRETSTSLGEQLATMHRHIGQGYGWKRDNTIGSTPQHNSWSDNWVTFFKQQRLGYQLELASSRGADSALLDSGQQLLERLPRFFSSYQPAPSLLHGDLWGGNWGADENGNPVLFDPAVYYGDREADLAMTELFGGFDDRFYHSYRGCWDIDPGYATRKVLYKLYHVLNHFNLFGGAYAAQARDMIDRLLAET